MKTTSHDKQNSSSLMKGKTFRWLYLLPILGAFTAQAATVGWYRMEGTVGDQITSVTTFEGSGPALSNAGARFNYGSNVAGPQIYDPVSDTTYANTSSLEYTGDTPTAYIQAVDTTGGPFDVADFTIEMFVKVDDTIGGSYAQFIRHYDASSGWALRILPESGSGGSQGSGLISNSSVYNVSNPAVIDDGNWHHLAMAVKTSDDGNNFARLYFDYQLMYENTTASYLDDYIPEIASYFRINADEFSGFTDEYRFSDNILTPDKFLVAIPEPGTLTLLGVGMIAVVLGARRRSKR